MPLDILYGKYLIVEMGGKGLVIKREIETIRSIILKYGRGNGVDKEKEKEKARLPISPSKWSS
jgi:hypothetical protein